MSRIRGKNTKPEILVRKFLFSKGYRFRLYDKNLPGKPDIILKKYKTVIFINGCFWHGHTGCKYFVLPKTRTKWWEEKINKTKERDSKNQSILLADGWNVFVIWECDLKGDKSTKTLDDLIQELQLIHRSLQ